MQEDRRAELIRQLQKRWGGPHALRVASEAYSASFLPTGFRSLDELLGGGLPAGRITTLHGALASGGTTFAYAAIAASQQREYIPAYLDVTGSFDPVHAVQLGVDLSRLTIITPHDPLEALAISTTLARSGGFDLIVFDRSVRDHRKMLSTWLGCMATLLHRANTALLLLSGLGEADSPHAKLPALAHYSSVILSLRRSRWEHDDAGDITGLRVVMHSIKNKTTPHTGETEIAFSYRKEPVRLANSLLLNTGLRARG